MRRLLMVGVVVMLAGCTPPELVKQQTDKHLTDAQSEAYKSAWRDGCESAIHEAGVGFLHAGMSSFKRDDQRYKSDPDYAMAWSDGARICKPGSTGVTPMFLPKK